MIKKVVTVKLDKEEKEKNVALSAHNVYPVSYPFSRAGVAFEWL